VQWQHHDGQQDVDGRAAQLGAIEDHRLGLQLEVFVGQHDLQSGNEARQQHIDPVQVQAEEVARVKQYAGQRLVALPRLSDLQALLQSHVEARQVDGQDLLARLLGAEDLAQRPNGLRPAGLVLVDGQRGRQRLRIVQGVRLGQRNRSLAVLHDHRRRPLTGLACLLWF